MTNIKATKRALGSSVLALFLCFAMLLGTTFAWFTDTVTSANNIITAGNLDVELEYAKVKDGEIVKDGNEIKWTSVQGSSEVFDPDALWEPGRVEIVYLKVSNLGTLDLKYQLGVNVYSETPGVNVNDKTFKLSEHLVFKVVEMPNAITTYTDREAVAVAAGTEKGLKDYNGKTTALTAKNGGNDVDYLALIVYMPETVGNEANYRGDAVPQITLGINLFATQYNSEEDSFGSNYDEYAPIVSVPEALPDVGNTTTPVVMTLKGYGDTEKETVSVAITKSVIEKLKDANVTEVSLSVSKPVVDATANTITFDSIEIVDQNGKIVELSNLGLTEKITVTLPAQTQFDKGEKVTIYHDGVAVAIATVDENGVISYDVEHLCEVTVGAADVPATDGKTYTISTLAQLLYFAQDVNSGNTYKDKTVILGADIDLLNMEWTPIGTGAGFEGVFDGNGHTISNLKITGNKSTVGLFANTYNGEIKNLTVKNANVSGRLNVGVVAGNPYTSKYTNITVTGHVEVNGFAYVGGVGGKNAYANWTNITVNVDETSYVKANSVENGTAYRTYVGGVVGFNGEGGHTFSNITSNIDVYGSTCDVGGAFGIAHYGNKFENVTVTGNVTITDAEEVAEAEEMGGIAGVWHNGGENVTFTNCEFTGKLSANVEADLSNNTITGKSYNANGTGKLYIDGTIQHYTVDTVKEALAAGENVVFADNMVGNITVVQSAGVKLVIDGNGYILSGVITVDGKSARYETAALTIQNVNFAAETLNADAFIRLGHTDAARYTNNVTVKDCTFSGNGFVAVKSYTGGDWNVTLDNLTVNKGMHSLAQLKNVEKNLVVTNCKVYSKNGLNINNGTNLTMDGCTFDVQGYAVRFGSDTNTTDETFVITNSTLKSACAEASDAVIELRAGATNAVLTLTNTKLEGNVTFKGLTTDTKVTIDGVTAVYDGDSLKAALAADKDVIFVNDITMSATESNAYGKTGINVNNGQTIDGNGYTLKVTGAGGTWDSAISTTGGIIKNLTVAQGFRGIFVNHNSTYSETVVLDNVTIKGPTYTISCDQGTKQNLVATNCTIKGWTSYAATIGEVKFENCTFGKGAGYNFSRPYASTEYVDCTFEAGHTIDARAAVTFENCTIAGAALTADNLATLVTSNIKNASVK